MKKIIDIIPGESLAGIRLDSKINDIISELSKYYSIEMNDGVILLNDGLITIGYEEDGSIYSIMCNKKFEGKYEEKLWAGMSVKDVLKHSSTQVAFGGCVVVDGLNGIGLPLPDGYDDFEKITDFLPLSFIFNHLSIYSV